MTNRLSRRAFLRQAVVLGSAAACTPGLRGPTPVFDLLVRGGTVADGTRAAPFQADIGIAAGRIAAIGRLEGATALRELDAAGLLVAPGFVDAHAHSDLRRNPRAQSKLLQGVTMDVTGPDGGSAFPTAHCADFAAWRGQHGPVSIGIGSYIGHGTVREAVLGQALRVPDGGELVRMQGLVAAALEQGALGLSSGLEYFPGNQASTDELVALCEVAARFGRPYVTHIRNEDDELLEAVTEAIAIARRSGATLLLSHLKVGGKPNWPKIDALLELVERARAEGLDVWADRYPYEAWATSLSANYPGWAKEGGRFVARLQDPAERERMRGETERAVAGNGGWGVLMLSSGLGAEDRELAGMRLDAAATMRGMEPYALACELLTRGNVGILGFGMSEANMDRILVQPWCLVASDGSAVPRSGRNGHPRSFGTFPRAWRRYVREQRSVTPEAMVRKMAALPAAVLRLGDRGVLAVGARADLVAFDPAAFTDRATWLEPQEYAEGVRLVLVGGAPAVLDGAPTGALAGQVVTAGG